MNDFAPFCSFLVFWGEILIENVCLTGGKGEGGGGGVIKDRV